MVSGSSEPDSLVEVGVVKGAEREDDPPVPGGASWRRSRAPWISGAVSPAAHTIAMTVATSIARRRIFGPSIIVPVAGGDVPLADVWMNLRQEGQERKPVQQRSRAPMVNDERAMNQASDFGGQEEEAISPKAPPGRYERRRVDQEEGEEGTRLSVWPV